MCCGLDLANCRNCDEKAIQVHKLLHFPNCQTLCLCRQTMIHGATRSKPRAVRQSDCYQDPGGLEFSSADSHASSPHKLPLVDYHSSSQRLSDIPQPFWHKSAKFSWKALQRFLQSKANSMVRSIHGHQSAYLGSQRCYCPLSNQKRVDQCICLLTIHQFNHADYNLLQFRQQIHVRGALRKPIPYQTSFR